MFSTFRTRYNTHTHTHEYLYKFSFADIVVMLLVKLNNTEQLRAIIKYIEIDRLLNKERIYWLCLMKI